MQAGPLASAHTRDRPLVGSGRPWFVGWCGLAQAGRSGSRAVRTGTGGHGQVGATALGARRAATRAGGVSGRVADVAPAGDVVGAGVAAEEDGPTGRAQPPVRLGGWIQRGITLEEQSTAPALLGPRLVNGQWLLGATLDVSAVLVAHDGIWSGGHGASCGGGRTPVPAAPARLPPPRRIRLGGWRVVMSVGGPCPHEAVRAEGHEDDDGDDQEFHGHSLPLPRCGRRTRPQPRICPTPYT